MEDSSEEKHVESEPKSESESESEFIQDRCREL
jgi:hypothetical protein